MPRIDCQSHVFPAAYAELLTRNPLPVRATGSGDDFVVHFGDVFDLPINLERYAPARKLREMDVAGIDVSVISVNIPTPDCLPVDLAVEGARICNDYVAEVCARHPGRFAGLASLPLGDAAAAIAELDRALDHLDLRGVFLPSHVDGAPLDAPELGPVYRHAAARGAPLVLHPTVPVWSRAIRDHAMIPMLGFMVDTSIAMLRLILGGVLEQHPDLRIVHPHAGGILPYIMGRVEEQTEVKRRGREHITRPPGDYYRNVYLDLATPSPRTLRYAYEYAGPERLLFASDHPWIDLVGAVDLLAVMDLSVEDRARVMGGNACQIFGIE